METLQRTFSFGKIDYNGNGKKENEVTINVKLEYKDGKPTFSASGNIWNNRKTDIYMGGQCIDSIYEEFGTEIKNKPLYEKIMGLWERNHLNDMNAGNTAQREAIKEWEAQGNKYEYKAACNHLISIGKYVHEGYKYGTAWLYRPISEEDLKEIESLFN